MTKIALLTIAAVATALPAAWSAREKAAARRITAAGLAAHVRFLADDLLEGRAPASRGSELAMRYIATEYERIGLTPAGDDGGWLQKFDIVGVTPWPRDRRPKRRPSKMPTSSSSATASPRPSRNGTITATSTCAAKSSWS
jgi:hypothetical protein